MKREESGETCHNEWQVNESYWPELGVLESGGAERIHLRRASLPAGRSGLWTSNFANYPKGVLETSSPPQSAENDVLCASIEPSSIDYHPSRSQSSSDPQPNLRSEGLSTPLTPVHSTGNPLQDLPGVFPALPTRLPQRRESLPFNFPDPSRTECWSRQGRRESLPTDCFRILNADDMLPELNIASMTPLKTLSSKKEKRLPTSHGVQPPTSVPSSPSFMDLGNTDEKENVSVVVNIKSVIYPNFISLTSVWNVCFSVGIVQVNASKRICTNSLASAQLVGEPTAVQTEHWCHFGTILWSARVP